MAAFTPQRPLPGAYLATPAPSGARTGFNMRFGQGGGGGGGGAVGGKGGDGGAVNAGGSDMAVGNPAPAAQQMTVLERAARTINEAHVQDLKYPELDNYVTQGISSDYDISSGSAWVPFQRGPTYQIPDRIFEQYDRAHLVTMMGLFADLRHAWVSIDNALYLWDYTHPNPPLVGFEEQPNPITAVTMFTPRTGVFVERITKLLAIATTVEIIIVGLAVGGDAASGLTLELFRTNMSAPVRGLNVQCLQGSADGRLFFTCTVDNDVYEVTYQQEERWFYSRCAKVNHTASRLAVFTPSFSFGAVRATEYTIQMAVDDSRRLLYTLSTDSTIRAFHMRSGNTLNLAITRTLRNLLDNIGHMTAPTELLTPSVRIVSIDPISAREASRLHLCATTSTGCRIFLSATSSYGFMVTDASSAPMSMQVHHVKFPPTTDRGAPHPQTASAPGAPAATNTTATTLTNTRVAARYDLGAFFCLVTKDGTTNDELFVSAPDSGRIARPQEPAAAAARCPEQGIWFNLNSRAEAIGVVSRAPLPSSRPQGAANEMAVQFERPATEVAVLTNSGIHCLRRQRLVDIYVHAVRSGRGGGGDDGGGNEGTVKRFIRLYGRAETMATALAVACGQGFDGGEGPTRSGGAALADPAVADQARNTFIEFGGRPQLNENMLVDQAAPTVEMVRPSPRHDGLALYLARLLRSFWAGPVIKENKDKEPKITSVVSKAKLSDVQQDAIRLKKFLDDNKSFIDGLAGPDALGRASTRQQEISLQGEHRALHALVRLLDNVIEGIAFVQMLFAERMDDVFASLSEEAKGGVRSLTYASLFTAEAGKEVAKELVKAVVHRNILNGANVETVADALRRQCGSFCSPSDVIIFKSQELVRRAADAGVSSELSRNLLNDSLKLFTQVAGDLSAEQLQNALAQYTGMRFYAGAIQLALTVAKELDRGNRALAWIQNGRPDGDPGQAAFRKRRHCYDLIKEVLQALDEATQRPPDNSDDALTLATKRRKEAYEVVDTSDDEAFQTDLYDWYLDRDQADRLLIIQSPFVVAYLRRRAPGERALADLLARYHSQKGEHYDAASVQLDIARAAWPDMTLEQRVDYLSRAKANASLQYYGPGRQHRQKLLADVGSLLDTAGIQMDTRERLKQDTRFEAAAKEVALRELGEQILDISYLYNHYIDQAGYHDLALMVYVCTNHLNPTDIRETWRNLIAEAHQRAERDVERGLPANPPREAVIAQVRATLAAVGVTSSVVPVPDVLGALQRYRFQQQPVAPPRAEGAPPPPPWTLDLLLDAGVRCEALFAPLAHALGGAEEPWARASVRVQVAEDVLYLVARWEAETLPGQGAVFGGPANAQGVEQALDYVQAMSGSTEALRQAAKQRQRSIAFRRGR